MVISPAHSSRMLDLHQRTASTPLGDDASMRAEPVEVWDSSVRTEFLTGGLRYGAAKAEGLLELGWGPGLSESPAAKIGTPVLVMPGFLAPEDQFESLLEHLTGEGANGGRPYYVRDGQVFEDAECTRQAQSDSEARVFRVVPHDSQDGPEKGADQIALAQSAIATFTGKAQMDILAHSQGGLAARLHADRGHAVRKMMMVGTPNQGSRAAHLTLLALKNGISWAGALAGVGPQAAGALEWLSPGNRNPKLTELNANFERQKSQVQEMIIVGSDGFDSPLSAGQTGPGDGLIPVQALGVGDLEVKVVPGDGSKCHYTMMNDPDVYREMANFFNW